MSIATRKPTGKPPWPILLIAGAEKTGKSWACAEASSSDLVGRTFWVGVGEDDPDEYGAVSGARFEIVEHDSTYRGILTALTAAKDEPPTNGKPNLIVLDSAGQVWDLLCNMAQAEANRRAIAKAKKYNKAVPDEDVQITMDLWNVAKSRWQNILGTLREHRGPSIVTARLEEVSVVVNGQPTTDKTMKIKAEKSLPYDVGAIVEMPKRGDAYLTGVRSVAMASESDRVKLPKFTADNLWRRLGLVEKGSTAPRQHHHAGDGTASVEAEDQLVNDRLALLGRLSQATPEAERAGVANQWFANHGHILKDTTDLVALTALVESIEKASS